MTTPITDKLRAILEEADKATAGPWKNSVGGYQILTGDSWNTVCVLHEGAGDKWRDHRRAQWENGKEPEHLDANADFIASARTNVPRLAEALMVAEDILSYYAKEHPSASIALARINEILNKP
jgi:hypothetical protein